MIILLAPGQLLQDHTVLQSLHIRKQPERIDYETLSLSEREIKASFGSLPEPAKKLLAQFGDKGIAALREHIRRRYSAGSTRADFESFYRQAALRMLHELFVGLRPYTAQLKWYHRLKLQDNRYKTAPCRISNFKPLLHFDVIKEKGRLDIRVKVKTIPEEPSGSDGETTPQDLAAFHRHHFLLEQHNTYFLLGYRDFRLLDWLEENPPSQYGEDAAAFSHHVLTRLEAHHPVNRNALVEAQKVEAVPVNRLLLSELNGTFLLLTPQWVYDDFLVEGPFTETAGMNRGGNTYIIRRNQEAETGFLRLLRGLHPAFEKQHNGYFFLSFADAQKKQWFLKTYHQLQGQDIELAGMDMLRHFRYSPHAPHSHLEVLEEEDELLSIRLEVSFGKEKVSLGSLQKTLLAGQRAVLLKGHVLGILNDDWLRQYATLLLHGKLAGDRIRIPRWVAMTRPAEDMESGSLKPVLKAEWWKKWTHWQEKPDTLYAPPASLQATLRPYQQKGYEWLLLLAETGAGACLADDMGLGKTLQTIAFLLKRLEQDPAARQLVVCPASLVYNWEQEFRKFAPAVPCIPYHGASRALFQAEEPAAGVLITSFGTLRADEALLTGIDFDTVVIDESHHIKNPDALITRAVNRLRAAARITLSGTPVMNNTFDLYSQLHFLLPGMFGSREFFRKQYANPIDRDRDEEKTGALRRLTAPFILRRTKEQVAPELPEKTEIIRWCDMGDSQREQYETIKSAIRDSIFLEIKQQGISKSKLAIIQGITRLRQVCNSPLLLPPADRISTDSIKTDLLMEELSNDLRGRKVLVFSQFSSMLRLISDACQAKGIEHYHFDGSTPSRERMELVNNFQDAHNPVNVFLISLMAGNTGLNLTAAPYIFLFDPWWNTAVQEQAIDRSHRIGQTKKVFAYKMVCRDSIEEKIIAMQQQKKQLAGELIGEGDGFVKQLSLEDLEYLLA